MRAVFDAILYLLRTGCQWRQLPADFPPWPTAHSYFRRWRIAGFWTHVKVPVADPVFAIPPDAEQDDLGWKPAALEHRYGGEDTLQKPVCYPPNPVNATLPDLFLRLARILDPESWTRSPR